MSTTATITVYLQALGGKFLGPNAYNHERIELSLALPGEPRPQPIPYRLKPNGNDGGIGPDFLYRLPSVEALSSFLPILTPQPGVGANPTVHYLTPNNLTISGSVTVSFSSPTVLGTIRANIPRPQGDDLVLTQNVALDQLHADYRVIMVVPGLLLEEYKALPPTPPEPDLISVYVKMMCGCPVKSPGATDAFWVKEDFLVSAEVFDKNGGAPQRLGLTLSDTTPSLFQAAVNNRANIKHVNFTALQKSTGNIGYLSVDYPG